MKFYRSKIKLLGKEKELILVNTSNNEKENLKQEPEQIHFIQVLDRSYSMCNDLDKLIENVKETIDKMDNNDLISVVWFSGSNECKTLIKGSTKNSALNKLLDTLKSPIGSTCFSEPLKEVRTIIDDLKELCPYFVVTFFTDGQPCVPWSYSEECDKIFKELDQIPVMALNTIGYGYGYNKELLTKMADTTLFGRFYHSSKINDYSEIIKHSYETAKTMKSERIKVESESPIIYLSTKETKLCYDKLELNYMDKRKNQIAIILSEGQTEFSINDEVYNINDIKNKVLKSSLNNILYTYAYELYYKGDGDQAAKIYSENLRDKYPVDLILNSFSSDERQSTVNVLNEMIFKNSKRMLSGECDVDYVPDVNAFCVMDLFRILSNGDNYYLPNSKNYNRIGLKVNDNYDLFESNNEEIKTNFTNFDFNNNFLNLNITFAISGNVKINPKSAKKVGLDKIIKSKKYKTHTIIKDGILNVKELDVILDRKTLDKIILALDNKLDPNVISIINNEDDQHVRALIKLDGIPIVNASYARFTDLKEIIDDIKEFNSLDCEKKVLVYYRNSKAENGENTKKLTPEQIEVLKENGINPFTFAYQGVDRDTYNKEDLKHLDFYEARSFTFNLKGLSSTPSVNAALKKFNEIKEAEESGKNSKRPKKLNLYEKTIIDFYEKYSDITVEEIEKRLNLIKQKMLNINLSINAVKLAKVLTGSFWDNLELDDKGNYLYKDEDDVLVIKQNREKRYFN